MQQDIDGVVVSVVGRKVGQNKDKTIYDIAFSDQQTYTTFDGELAGRAKGHADRVEPVTARVSVKQNGQYTNFYFDDIAPRGQLPALAVPQQQAGGAIEIQGASTSSIPMVDGQGGANKTDYRSKEEIVRQNASSAAFASVSKLFDGAGPEAMSEFVPIARRLTEELVNHALTGHYGSATTTPTSSQAVAAVVNGEAGSEVVTVGGDPEW